ncbi:MAG: hypothetical protein U0163_07505 [Gemmatimonadaceae bacterium]
MPDGTLDQVDPSSVERQIPPLVGTVKPGPVVASTTLGDAGE